MAIVVQNTGTTLFIYSAACCDPGQFLPKRHPQPYSQLQQLGPRLQTQVADGITQPCDPVDHVWSGVTISGCQTLGKVWSGCRNFRGDTTRMSRILKVRT